MSDDNTKRLVESKEDMLDSDKKNKNDNYDDDIMNLFSDEETDRGNNNSKTDNVIDNEKIKTIQTSKFKR